MLLVDGGSSGSLLASLGCRRTDEAFGGIVARRFVDGGGLVDAQVRWDEVSQSAGVSR